MCRGVDCTVPPRRLLYRSDREYDEAIKCYKNALRMEKDNLQVRAAAGSSHHVRGGEGEEVAGQLQEDNWCAWGRGGRSSTQLEQQR